MRRALAAALLPVVFCLATSACQNQSSGSDEPAGGTGGGAGNGGNAGSGGGGGNAGEGGNAGTGGSNTELPDPLWLPEGSPSTWNDISFIVPRGMTAREVVEGIEMLKQTTSGATTRTCLLLITPPRPKVGELATQSVAIMTEFFASQGISLADERGGADLIQYRAHGVSARGFDYVELTAELRPGEPSLARGKMLLINLGSAVVPIFGVASDNLGCVRFDNERNMGQPDGPRTEWQALYYSLEFSGLAANAAALEGQLIGKWSSFSGGVLNGEIYAANGRYASAKTWVRDREISPTEIERTISTFSGEGDYVLDHETLGRFPDGEDGEANLFRIVQRYKHPVQLAPGEPNPHDELFQMKSGPLPDGTRSAYELGLVRVPE